MSILTANLKHLYQRRGVWLWYLVIMCQIPMIYSFFLARDGRYLGYLVLSFLSGAIAASIQKEILSKPFSFCLPGHNEIPRRFILWVGVVLNGLLGFVFMFYPGLEFPSVFLVVLAGGVVGLTVYLLCAALNLFSRIERRKYTLPLMIIVVLIAVCAILFAVYRRISVEHEPQMSLDSVMGELKDRGKPKWAHKKHKHHKKKH